MRVLVIQESTFEPLDFIVTHLTLQRERIEVRVQVMFADTIEPLPPLPVEGEDRGEGAYFLGKYF